MHLNFLIQTIIDIAKVYPDRTAIHVNGRYYSYREFTRISNAIKEIILKENKSPPNLIGILTGDDVYTYASIVAILATGSAYVPINENNPVDRNSNIINDAKLEMILGSRYHKNLIKSRNAVTHDCKIIYTNELQASDSDLDCNDISDNQLFYVLFTSGSTGKPKGVPIYHKNLNSFMSIMLDKENYSFSENDRFLQMFQLSFDMSVVSFFTPLCLGACCYVVPSKGIAYLNIVKTMQEHKITVAFMVPSVLSYIEKFFDELELSSMRYSIFAGESLLNKFVERWSRCIPNALIQNSYGPSETTIVCFSYDLSESIPEQDIENGVVSFGKPFQNTGAIIIDDECKPVAKGETGELCLWGDQVTDHYLNNMSKSKQVFIKLHSLGIKDIAYLTGDMCYVNESGNYIFCGRKDFQIKIDGHRIELEEIEYLATEYSGVNVAAAVPIADVEGLVTLCLYIEGNDVKVVELIEYLNTKLPAYMVPKEVVLLNKLPLNLNGKIDRKMLCEM